METTTNNGQTMHGKSMYDLDSKLRPYLCDLCDMKFTEKIHVKRHMGNRHLPKDVQCPECPVMVNSISILSHQHVHRKKHICEKCGKLFQTPNRLQAHVEKCVSSENTIVNSADLIEKKYKCMVCTYRGTTQKGLNKHVRIVHLSKNLEKTKTCDICNKQFHSFAFASHRRTHGRKQCEICFKWLSTGSGFLKKHMMNHEKEGAENKDKESVKPETSMNLHLKKAFGSDSFYRCFSDGCDYQTHVRRFFVRHWNNIHEPRTLKCDHPGCPRRNMNLGQLWKHRRIHKRKDCQNCGIIFNDLKDLKQHLSSNICKNTYFPTENRDESISNENLSKTTDQGHPREINSHETSDHNGTGKVNIVEINIPCKHCGKMCNSNELKNHLEICDKILSSQITENTDSKSDLDPHPDSSDSDNDEMMLKLEPEIELREDVAIKSEPSDTECDDPLSNSNETNVSEEKIWFNCEMCNYHTDIRKYLTKHISSQHDPNPIECTECQKLFSRPALKKHMLIHIRAFKCLVCEKSFATGWKLNYHVQRLHPEIENLVQDIGNSIPKTEVLENVPEIPVQCRTNENKLSEFEESCSKEKLKGNQLNCEKCDYSTKKLINLQYHVRMMHHPQMINCPDCGKKVSKGQYRRHVQTHTLEYSCSLCPKRVATRYKLKIHIKNNHPDRDDLIDELNTPINNNNKTDNHENSVIQCAHCEYTALKRRNFVKHFSRMHAITRCTCQFCGQSVSQIDFKRHLSRHTNAPQKTNSYMCEKCSKVFVEKRSLDVHVLSCNGEVKVNSQQFKCDICDFATGTKRSLRNHYKQVHAPKDSQCPICLKMYRKAKLASHVSWHGHRYTCSLCGKSNFGSKWHLKSHILSVHPGNEQLMADQGLLVEQKVTEPKPIKTVECEVCGKMIKSGRMKKHLQIHNKQFECTNEGCTKLFANPFNLKVHVSRCKKRIKEEVIDG
uniref:CSON009351 protein n=1 Tax=Culicoides sonorensis TaxID=179676 RepID=A0A336M3V1_CULSO